ncbi:MAG: hypothetical protein AAF471_01115 [Myxococcota bacterium]
MFAARRVLGLCTGSFAFGLLLLGACEYSDKGEGEQELVFSKIKSEDDVKKKLISCAQRSKWSCRLPGNSCTYLDYDCSRGAKGNSILISCQCNEHCLLDCRDIKNKELCNKAALMRKALGSSTACDNGTVGDKKICHWAKHEQELKMNIPFIYSGYYYAGCEWLEEKCVNVHMRETSCHKKDEIIY